MRISRKWLILSYGDPDALRAQDLPYDSVSSTHDAIFSTCRETYTATNDFVAGDMVRLTASGWVLSQADTSAHADVSGIVETADETKFTVVFPGGLIKTLTQLVPGTTYYLSAADPGGIVDTSPTDIGTVSIPVLMAITATTARVLASRGLVNAAQSDPQVGPQGAQGDAGTTGSQGPQGYQGPQGGSGSDGAQGSQGDIGPQGSQGAYGSQGPQGSQGHQGSIGATGSQGPRGYQGSQGNPGSQGSQGIRGYQGSQGNQGYIGPQGDQGSIGATGSQGPQGSQGSTGPQGQQGYQGSQGTTGSQGPQGYQGPQGSILFQSPPSSSTSAGTQGTQIYADGYVYVCVSTNQWVKWPVVGAW